jgi:hypothetical protein
MALNWGELFSGVQTQAIDAIQAVLPMAVTIFAALVAIKLAIKVYNRVTGR